jgi:hypothetical protein
MVSFIVWAAQIEAPIQIERVSAWFVPSRGPMRRLSVIGLVEGGQLGKDGEIEANM